MVESPRPLRVPTERIEELIKDEMNQTSTRFIAITDARVYDAVSRELLYTTDFLLVANGHILTVTPRQCVTIGQPPWSEAPQK